MDLSIVIPVYNESKKIASDIIAAGAFFKDNDLRGEIIVVDDGSSDHTAEVVEDKQAHMPENVTLEIIRTEHKGKGHAVRTGIKATTGDYVMFVDSGACVPFEDIHYGLKLIKAKDCDIAHGSRKIEGCHIDKSQNLYRRLCSRFFHWFVIHLFAISAELTDTQCGFKIYRGDVGRHIYGECFINGYTFDIEVIIRALKEGYRIKEFAIDWTCDPDSRLLPARNSLRILHELLYLRWKILNK